MKKNLIFLAAGALIGFSFLTSCSDDDDDNIGFKVEEKTFTDGAGLTLNVSGQPMLGKTVKVIPGTDNQATISMSSSFDLSGVELPVQLPVSNIQCPGVLPGSPVTDIPVTLVKDGATAYTFSGTGDATYCTYAYSGRLEEGSIALDITDVKLKNATLSNTTWNLVPYADDITNSALHIVWEPEDAMLGIDLGFGVMPYPLQKILQLACAIPLIENPTDAEGEAWNVAQMLDYSLKSITFLEDGNIKAEYVDSENNKLETSPINLIQYVVTGEGKMLIFLNPYAIYAADHATKALDVNALIKQLCDSVLPMLANGVPLEFTVSENNLALYMGTEPLLSIVKAIVNPICSDEQLIASLVEAMKADESMADYADLLGGILPQFPGALEKTTKIELGLNLVKK